MKYTNIKTLRFNHRLSAYILSVVVFLSISSLVAVLSSAPVGAVKVTGWDPGNIMSDAIMANKNSMTQSQIQSFLNGKNTCKTSPKNPSALTEINKAGTYGYLMSGGTKFQYHLKNGKFVCLADQSFNGESAARIIYRAAQDYNINPQVLIVLLQKENGLITDNWPNYNFQYATATGYACPDSGPNNSANCNSNYFGFKNQVRHAANMFRTLLNGQGWNNYPIGNNDILYSPNCSGTGRVNVKNRATGALYTYTPYQPNSATLSRDWPVTQPYPSCGAFGNLNFYMFFKSWFGDTKYSIEGSILKHYDNNNGAITLGSATNRMSSEGNGFFWQIFEKGVIAGRADTGYYIIKGSIGKYYIKSGNIKSLGPPLGNEVSNANGTWSQRFSKGYIIGKYDTGYYAVKGSISKHYDNEIIKEKLGIPLGNEKSHGDGIWSQSFTNGDIVGSYKTGYWTVKGSIGKKYWEAGGLTGRIGLPLGDEIKVGNDIFYQSYENGYIVGRYTTGYWTVKGSIGKKYSPDNINILGVPLEPEEKIDNSGIWQQKFSDGYILGSSKTGYWVSSGTIRDYWLSQGQWNGSLGNITGPLATGSRNMLYQRYENGYIVVNPNSNKAWESKGSIRKVWAELGYQSGKLGFPTGPESKSSNGIWSQTYEHGKIETKNGRKHKVTLLP